MRICKKHPRYKACRPPKTDCPECQKKLQESQTFDHGKFGKRRKGQ